MSEVLEMVRPAPLTQTPLFVPSIAQSAGRSAISSLSGVRTSAIWAFGLSATFLAGLLPTSSVVAAPFQFAPLREGVRAPLTRRGAATRQMVARTTQEMVEGLKAGGLPIAAIADILNVERKTVYSWLDGVEAQVANHDRLHVIHAILAGEQDGALRYYSRVWERKLPDGGSLKALLAAPDISQSKIKDAFEFLRSAVLRAMAADSQRKARPPSDVSPAASLTLQLRAGA